MEVNLEKERTLPSKSDDRLVREVLDIRKLDATYERAIGSDGKNAFVRDVFAPSKVKSLETCGGLGKSDDDTVRTGGDIGQIEGNEVLGGGKHPHEGLVR